MHNINIHIDENNIFTCTLHIFFYLFKTIFVYIFLRTKTKLNQLEIYLSTIQYSIGALPEAEVDKKSIPLYMNIKERLKTYNQGYKNKRRNQRRKR